jgi:hypothetical protein
MKVRVNLMDTNKTIRRFASHEEQKAEVYRYWRSRPMGERLAAVWDATAAAYAFKGITYDPTRRSEATLTRIQRPKG